MVAYKSTRKMSVAECAYVAGILDGEGTVTLTAHQKGGSRFVAVSVSNTDLKLLQYLVRVTGVGKITNKRVVQQHHTPSFAYHVYSRQALGVLAQVELFLRTYKKKRAKLVLKEYVAVTPRNGKYTEAMRRKKEKFIEKFFAITP